ncbi:MAG: DUF4397 domain-containing protein [Peptostreptococcaceae bacterium]|nr:DUF4397 domain-containing protein [Peptostreptococcaceae bacterium]
MRQWNKEYSLVRFLHAVPEGEEVDIYINNVPFYKGLEFTEFSPYVYVPQGNYTVTIYLEDTQENPIVNEKIDVNVNELVTIAITGESGDIKLLSIVEETEVVSGSNAKVRVVHLSPNAPAVNIVADNQELFANVKYRDVTPYIAIPAKEYTVNVEEARTNRIIRQNQVTINPGRIYTFYAVGNIPNAQILQSLDGATFMN